MTIGFSWPAIVSVPVVFAANLEGVALPAGKQELVDYASRHENRGVSSLLQRLPDREYRSLDEVGEELAPVQPDRRSEDAAVPHVESGDPPAKDRLDLLRAAASAAWAAQDAGSPAEPSPRLLELLGEGPPADSTEERP